MTAVENHIPNRKTSLFYERLFRLDFFSSITIFGKARRLAPCALQSTRMIESPSAATQSRVLSVGELNRLAREIIERQLPLTWVAGEISELQAP